MMFSRSVYSFPITVTTLSQTQWPKTTYTYHSRFVAVRSLKCISVDKHLAGRIAFLLETLGKNLALAFCRLESLMLLSSWPRPSSSKPAAVRRVLMSHHATLPTVSLHAQVKALVIMSCPPE